jgi:stress response protein YsnF
LDYALKTRQADRPTATGIPVLDWMLMFQRAALAAYSLPLSSGSGPVRSAPAPQSGKSVEVIPLGEEVLNVGTRVVPGETTVIRREVVEAPVERQVKLRQERVIVERRPAGAARSTDDVLTNKVSEMTDTTEVPVVWKSTHVREEVVLRKEVTEQLETVRDVVRRDSVQVVSENAGAQPGAQSSTAGRDIAPHIIKDPVEIARPVSHEDQGAEKAIGETSSAMPLTVAALREEEAKSHAKDPKPVAPPAPLIGAREHREQKGQDRDQKAG